MFHGSHDQSGAPLLVSSAPKCVQSNKMIDTLFLGTEDPPKGVEVGEGTSDGCTV